MGSTFDKFIDKAYQFADLCNSAQIGARHNIDEILADYPYLEREDIMQSLRYAAWLSEEREVMLANA